MPLKPLNRTRKSKQCRKLSLESLELRRVLAVLPPTGDLAEGNAAAWQTFASDSAAATVSNDATHVREGAKSLKFTTASGFDTGIRLPTGGDTWDLRQSSVIDF